MLTVLAMGAFESLITDISNMILSQFSAELALGASIDWHTLLEEDLVANFVVLPNYKEVETVHRETLENLGRSLATEKHKRSMLMMEHSRQSLAFNGVDWPLPRGLMGPRFLRHSWFDSGHTLMLQFTDLPECTLGRSPSQRNTCALCWPCEPARVRTLRRDGQLSSTWCCWKGGWQYQPTPSGPSDNSGRNMVSSVFITVGNPDAPWHPHFFRPKTVPRLRCGRMCRADSPRTLTSSLSCFHCLPLLLVSSRVHSCGPFKLDIVFRSSGLGTTGRRSVVYGRAAALERLF